jgi:hypothetical protein
MNPQTQAAYLRDSLAELDRALGHLEYSADSCADLTPRQAPPTEVWATEQNRIFCRSKTGQIIA